MQKLAQSKFLAITVLSSTSWIGLSLALASTPISPTERVILLTNRQVLRGEIALYGDRYLITQANSEIRLSRKRVERICHNMQEAYLHLQHQNRFASAGDHLRLAQWCLDENLPTQAEQQLQEAMLKQPDHPRIDLVRRQLESLAVTTDSNSTTVEKFNRPLSGANELEALTRQMPQGVVESFTRTIQPLLLNGCGARGCHGTGGDNQFTLHRAPRGQRLPQRLTLRNLQSVLTWIDQKNSGESPLLHFATTPHTGQRRQHTNKPAFAPDSPPMKRLAAWLAVLSEQGIDPVRTSPPHTPLAVTKATGTQSHTAPQALYNRTDPAEKKQGHAISQRQMGRKIPAVPFHPRDPFDAEIFNRRYHPQGP